MNTGIYYFGHWTRNPCAFTIDLPNTLIPASLILCLEMVITNMISIRHMSVSDKPYDKTNQRHFKEGKGKVKKSFIFSQITKKH